MIDPIRFVKSRLEAIIRYPQGWGTAAAVELQIILLLETLHVLEGKTQEYVDETHTRFLHFMGERGLDDTKPLAVQMEIENPGVEEFISVLQSFVEQEVEPQVEATKTDAS